MELIERYANELAAAHTLIAKKLVTVEVLMNERTKMQAEIDKLRVTNAELRDDLCAQAALIEQLLAEGASMAERERQKDKQWTGLQA